MPIEPINPLDLPVIRPTPPRPCAVCGQDARSRLIEGKRLCKTCRRSYEIEPGGLVVRKDNDDE